MKPFWNKILPDFILNLISKVHPDPLKCEVIPKVYVKRMEIDDGTSVVVDIEEGYDDNFSLNYTTDFIWVSATFPKESR